MIKKFCAVIHVEELDEQTAKLEHLKNTSYVVKQANDDGLSHPVYITTSETLHDIRTLLRTPFVRDENELGVSVSSCNVWHWSESFWMSFNRATGKHRFSKRLKDGSVRLGEWR